MKEFEKKITAVNRMAYEWVQNTESYAYGNYIQQMIACMPYLAMRMEASNLPAVTEQEKIIQREYMEFCNGQISCILNISHNPQH